MTCREVRMPTRRLVPVLVYLGTVTSMVSSLGAPLVPTIAQDTHVSLATAQWSLTISLLMGAVATPTLGRLGDGRHRRPAVLGALVTVVVGCVLAAVPGPFFLLLIGRGLMGVGLGLVPMTMAVARDALDGERRVRVVGLLSITAVAGIGLGYPLTGLIAEHFSFRAGFWFGAGVSVVGLLLAWVTVPSVTDRPVVRLDWVGSVLLGVGVAGVLLALGQAEVWSSSVAVGIVVVSLGLLGLWGWHELRTAHPLVELRLIRDRTVLTADVTGFLAGIGMYALLSMIIRFAQTPRQVGYGFGSSIVISGLLLLPLSFMSPAASRFVPALERRFGARTVLPLGCAIFVLANVLFILEHGSPAAIVLVMGVAGVGMGLTFAALPGLIVGNVPAHETGSAMSFNQVLRYVGYSMGSALSATVLQGHTRAGHVLPELRGYTSVSLIAIAVLVVAGIASAVAAGPRAAADMALVEESIIDGVPVAVD
jgi:predicted MFS family arabinose efflux permease